MNLIIRNHHYILFFGIFGSCVLLNSILPFYLMLFYLTIGNTLILLFNKLKSDEVKFYNISFSLGVFFLFISFFFLIFLNDDSQYDNDALNFFNLSTNFKEFDLLNLRIFTEGSIAVVIWRYIYEFFHFFGFQKGFYVGIFFNIFLFSISSIFVLKISKLVNKMNEIKINNLIFYYSFSGLLLLFATSHVRDIFIFFLFNLMIYLFLIIRKKYNIFFIPFSIIISICFGLIFFYLRTEYFALPILVLFSFLIEKNFLLFIDSQNKFFSFVKILFVASLGLIVIYNTQIFEFIVSGYNGYILVNENVQSLNDSQSLASILIVNQPIIIRYLLGSVYFIFSPIPFWSGLFSGSYFLFLKSFHVIMMYILVPVFYLQLRTRYFYSTNRLGLLIIFFIGYSSIVLTSLELRHLGTFIGLLFIFISDFDFKIFKNLYVRSLKIFLFFVLIIHLLWIIIKIF